MDHLAACSLFAPEDIEEAEPLMAGEDFAFYCVKVGVWGRCLGGPSVNKV